MKKLIFWMLSFFFFIVYFKATGYIWSKLVPFNFATEVISIFIFIVVIIPASLISSHLIIKSIENK